MTIYFMLLFISFSKINKLNFFFWSLNWKYSTDSLTKEHWLHKQPELFHIKLIKRMQISSLKKLGVN